MNITWINPAPIVTAHGTKTSERICVRLRSMLPGEELARRGHHVEQIFFQDIRDRAREPQFFQADVFVFGKAFADFTALIKTIRSVGRAKIVVDICDNVFCPPEDGLKSIYSSLLPRADAVVTSTKTLTAALHDKIPQHIPVTVIPEAIEGQRQAPDFNPRPNSIRLLWFGYPNNLPPLWNALPNLDSLTKTAEVSLSVVSDWRVLRTFPPIVGGIKVKCLQWSPPTMNVELNACDFVIIPSDDSEARATKSANRIITALWAGKFALAYPLPSYGPFARFAHVDRDFAEGIKLALARRDATYERISLGQQYIETHYGLHTITDSWEQALRLIAN